MDEFNEEEQRIDREITRSGSGADPFSAAVRATRMPMIITDPRLADNPIVFVNDAFLRLTGYGREEVLGRNCRFLQGPATSNADVARIRSAIDRHAPIELELLNYRKDGSTFWNRLLMSPVFHDEELTYFFASQFDVTREKDHIERLAGNRDSLESELQHRIADLTASEERLRFTLKAGRLGFWTLDLASRRLVASAICKQNFGRSPSDTFTYEDLQASILPSDFGAWEEAVQAALKEPGELAVEYRINLPEAGTRWIEVRGQTSFSTEGAPISMSGVSIDITERKLGEEQRDLMARELNHRVKNSLATVQSIFTQTLRSASSLAEAQQVVSARIGALAAAQDVLTDRGWARSELGHVVESALAPFMSEARIQFGGPAVPLSAAATTAFSLALHELATNALKYGALLGEKGTVAINWEIDGGEVELTWREAGGPAVQKPGRHGFGSKMIERALSSTIQGSATIDYRPAGVVFRARTTLGAIAPGVED